MEGPIVGVYGILFMFIVLFLLRIPVGFTMALVGFLGFSYVAGFKAALGMIGTDMWNIFSNYGLTVIPMFILVGEFAHYGGYNNTLYFTTYKWFGHYKGVLAITTIMACAAFSAISGSNTATAATMSSVALPEMKKYNYHPMLSAGSVVAGSTLGVMIPPSIVLVVYAIYTGQSIGKLFFGNVIPSAILTILIAATVVYICYRHPDWGPKGPKSSWKERFKALPDAIDIVILFLIIMVALFTVLVFMIVAGATIFGRFLAVTRLPFEAASWISTLPLPNWMLLWIILLCYMIGGCVMDALAFLLISLPIFYPIVQQMGYDPIWYGQVITITTTMGALMPPIGICCYVVAGMAKDIPIGTVFRGSLYYIPTYIIANILLMLSPYWTVMT